MLYARNLLYSATLLSLCVFGFVAYKSGSFASSEENPKVAKLKLQAGFRAEHLISPSEQGYGSWVAMCFDNKGRLITSDQYGGLYRLEIPPVGSADVTPKVERLTLENDTTQLGTAQGLLYAFNSLYVMVNNNPSQKLPQKSGLYRLEDTDGNDKFDKITTLKVLEGSGEHGPHSIRLSPDGKSLYVICGNHTDLPEMDDYRLPGTWQYDNLLPAIKDPRGHANDRKEPGGWIANVSPDGSRWELLSAGYRNPFDMAFNDIGDLFVYDADMEWDFGQPWYRPTRICQATSGSEFGWRTGDGKWSADYLDNLPPVLNIGQGSPTNLVYLKGAKFPKKYQQSLLAFDWSFGIMHALHLRPDGAGYVAEREEFLSGVPLPLTDGVIGPDGALYFMTGGRRIESDVYRVFYVGSEETGSGGMTQLTPENQLRRQLETLHDGPHPHAVATAFPQLNHPDRYIRYAARIALEHQPMPQWEARVLAATDPTTRINGILGLVRSTPPSTSAKYLSALLKTPYASMPETSLRVDFLRTLEVLVARAGELSTANQTATIAYLNPLYPAATAAENRGMAKILAYLQAPQTAAKTIALMTNAAATFDNTAKESADLILRNPQYGLDIAQMLEKTPPLEQTFYAVTLAKLKNGWTTPLRKTYFEWFRKAFNYRGGNSYVGFINQARLMALENVPADERDYYDELSGGNILSESGNDLSLDEYPKGPGKRWTVATALPLFDEPLVHRNFKVGKAMYQATTCNRCHAMQGEGGNIGPDLTRVGTRFTVKDMLEAIIEPSKAISDQYAAVQLQLKNGESMVGRISNEDAQFYYLSQNPYAPDFLTPVRKADIVSQSYSSVSIMLPGLINALNEDELKDLMAYLMAGGNPGDASFE